MEKFSNAWESVSNLASGAVEFVRTKFGEAWTYIEGKWNEHVTPIWNDISGFVGGAVADIQTAFGNAWTFVSDKWNEHVQPLFDTISDLDPFGAISSAFETAASAIGTAYDTLIKPAIDALSGVGLQDVIDMLTDLVGAAEKVVGGAVGKVAGFVSGGVSKIGGLFGGGGDDDGGGGGGVEDTTSGFGGGAGTVNQTFNITMEVSGITDRTDKRSLAEEVAAMIQDELSRNSNTTSYNISGR
jgi:hypothetical protein